MDFTSILDFLQNFQTGRFVSYIQSLKIGEIIHNPWVLGAIGGMALLALVMRWRVLLALILSISGFAGLINYTIQHEASAENLSQQTLTIFVIGGACIIFVVIYLLFIKTD
jgi:hypothetical protein